MFSLVNLVLLVLLFSVILLSNPVSSRSKCGYDSCNPVKDGMLNVHLVPHTHDDVGWLKTVDQYYYGARTNYQRAGVQYILDSVIEELLKDKTKRFIYVEIAFFARWWRQQHDMTRHLVRGLVNEGRLEFILGGWCMDDEATTHYNAIVDQHALGFEFLRQNFGECGRPRVAWQIDPFGHSREQASLFAQMGFDGLFFGRLDYQDKAKRMNTTTMEMLWRGSPNNIGKRSDLFTGVLFNGYSPPGGFCFDLLCNDDPIMDDEEMHDNNKIAKVFQFLIYAKYQAKSYATDHIIMTMGSDFNYQNAHTWYKNLDKLIQYVNEQQNNGSKVNLLYSTPSCYLYQLNKANKTWTTKQDDFFPYAHRPHSFWTGYFTSRPTLKEFVRKTNNFLQVCKQMDALAQLDDDVNSTIEIQVLREAMGVAQHHDAVSGTEKQHVAYDYSQRLAKGVHECQKVVNDAYNRLLPKGKDKAPGQLYCNLLNISRCHHTENYKQFVTTIYNPLGRNVTSWIKLPVIGKAYTVTDPYGYSVTAQIIPVSSETKRIPERKGSLAKNELVFKVSLPALGFNTYFIQMSNSILDKFVQRTYYRRLQGNGDITIRNQFVSLTFDEATGKLKQMQNLERGITLPLIQDYLYYVGHPGNNSRPKFQASGAYIFRPNITATHQSRAALKRKSYVLQGVLVQEVRQQFSPWLSQVVRLRNNERYAEFEWTVGPIPIGDNYGKEIVSRFTSDLKTSGIFYTDANGREMIKRTRDHRDTWTLNQTEEVAGNYYPINSRIYIQDTIRNLQLTVLTDRSQGGSSIQDGQVELMVHRRLLYDDNLGVGEALNETGADGKGLVARGKHYVFLDTVSNSASLHRDMALRLYMAPSVSFSDTTMKRTDWSRKYQTSWSGLKKQLPDNVHMLTLEQWGGPTIKPLPTQPYLLRFEHIYENGEDTTLSKPANITLKDMFVPFEVESVEELTLGANLQLSKLQRLNWTTADSVNMASQTGNPDTDTDLVPYLAPSGANNFTITLKPMEIRTFQVTLKKV